MEFIYWIDRQADRQTDRRTRHDVLGVIPAVVALNGGPHGLQGGQHATAAGLDDVDPLALVAILAQHHAASANTAATGTECLALLISH